MCQGKAAPAAQDSASSEWATLPASVCGVKWLRSPLTRQGEPRLHTCLTRLKTVIRSAPCPGHQTQRPSALWPCRVQQGWLSREGLACALGAGVLWSFPGARLHTTWNQRPCWRKGLRISSQGNVAGNSEVPSDCLFTVSQCTLWTAQWTATGLLGPNALRERKEATSRSCELQAPFSATH